MVAELCLRMPTGTRTHEWWAVKGGLSDGRLVVLNPHTGRLNRVPAWPDMLCEREPTRITAT